jgi:hemerythrin
MTESIGWKEEYCVGLPDIDDEHRGVFKLVDDLVVVKSRSEGKEIGTEVALSFLMRYVDSHLKGEEELFEQTDYPDKQAHIKIHREFAQKITLLRERFTSGETEIIDELISLVRTWLTEHILKIDVQYAEYCKKSGVGVESKFAF